MTRMIWPFFTGNAFPVLLLITDSLMTFTLPSFDMVLKSADVNEAPPLDRFFNFAITRKVNSELQPRAGSPRHSFRVQAFQSFKPFQRSNACYVWKTIVR